MYDPCSDYLEQNVLYKEASKRSFTKTLCPFHFLAPYFLVESSDAHFFPFDILFFEFESSITHNFWQHDWNCTAALNGFGHYQNLDPAPFYSRHEVFPSSRFRNTKTIFAHHIISTLFHVYLSLESKGLKANGRFFLSDRLSTPFRWKKLESSLSPKILSVHKLWLKEGGIKWKEDRWCTFHIFSSQSPFLCHTLPRILGHSEIFIRVVVIDVGDLS